MKEVDESRDHVNIVFIGHVDAGKSTICGNILYRTGYVDDRQIEKYQRDAKINKKESWFLAYIMDINEDERQKGKTVEVGKAFFKLEKKRFTILDAPGHGSFIPNMLQGACQADIAGLVISAKSGEFEAGFDKEKDGKTREHTLLSKSLGVTKLIVLVNKMDEESVNWSEERFLYIQKLLIPFIKMCGFDLEKDVFWIPISGLNGDFIEKPSVDERAAWYKGPMFFDILNDLELPKRSSNMALRLPLLDKYNEQGDYIMGKIEQGKIRVGLYYMLQPSRHIIEVIWLFNNEEIGVPYALPGESVRVVSLYRSRSRVLIRLLI